MKKIKIAVVGIGNCASSLLYGIEYYKQTGSVQGLAYPEISGYKVGDIEVVAAFDIDKRKVGRNIAEAAAQSPNCTMNLCAKIPKSRVRVQMGRILDSIAPHMLQYPDGQRFVVADRKPVNIVKALRDSGAEMLLNYLPVGSEKAARYYAECCLEAGVAFINNMPVFITADKRFSKAFEARKLPLIGDDIKSQLGATVLHRNLLKLFEERGIYEGKTYQLNIGGNTDFLNMLDRSRLKSKKISKTEAVQSLLASRLADEYIQIEPSGYIPWLKDNKICFIRIAAKGFGGAPIDLELRLSVEDSANSAGIVVDVVRCCKLALERKIGGVLTSISTYAMKHPIKQYPDPVAKKMLEDFIAGKLPR